MNEIDACVVASDLVLVGSVLLFLDQLSVTHEPYTSDDDHVGDVTLRLVQGRLRAISSGSLSPNFSALERIEARASFFLAAFSPGALPPRLARTRCAEHEDEMKRDIFRIAARVPDGEFILSTCPKFSFADLSSACELLIAQSMKGVRPMK
nr:hypothetical protein CFP56_30974 [Quercus suber]